jgi:integrase/recombinase XerD
MALQARGQVKPVSINSRWRVLNAFLRWAHQEGHLSALLKVPRLKEPEAVIQPWSTEQVKALVTCRASNFAKQRVQVLALLIADTGLRVSEAIALERADVDLDAMLVTVRNGKGGKARVVPMSVVGRKFLFRWVASHEHQRVVCTREGMTWTKRNALRSFKLLHEGLGITGVRNSWYTLRHRLAASFIREGGDVFSVQRMLGHSTLEMTKRYVRLNTTDLQAKHRQHARLLGASNNSRQVALLRSPPVPQLALALRYDLGGVLRPLAVAFLHNWSSDMMLAHDHGRGPSQKATR